MYFVDTPHPPGTVVVISHELARYSDFPICLLGLSAPAGSSLVWQKGVEIALSLNKAIEKMTGEWIFILGDDHSFSGDILINLLSANVDIIAPLCPGRISPYHPIAYDWNGSSFVQVHWEHIPPRTVSKIAGTGTAGMLIRKPVLDAIGSPWFEAGKISNQHISEDLGFCRKAAAAGFTPHLDSGNILGHITPCTISPGIVDGKLEPLITVSGGPHKFRPSAVQSQ